MREGVLFQKKEEEELKRYLFAVDVFYVSELKALA